MPRKQEGLLTLVEKLRKRIKDHGPTLRQSEMQTRYALVDPLLRELGWDTEKPNLVRPEYKGNGKADYALLNNGKPVMMVETKRLGGNLQKARDEQGIDYCKEEATRYLLVTDGRHWEIYDTYKTASKPIVQFGLENLTSAEVCKKASKALRRSNVLKKHDWQPISELNPQPKFRPVRVQFPDYSVISVKSWTSLLVEVTRWLIRGNHLKTGHCPILCKPKGRTHYAVSTKPAHSSNKTFGSDIKIRSFYVETKGGREYVSTACRTIIKRVGQNPAKFKVWFSPPRT